MGVASRSTRGLQSAKADLNPTGAVIHDADPNAHHSWEKAARYLAEHGLHLDPEFRPQRFQGGLANLNFLIKLDRNFAVLRRAPTGPLPRGANDMSREHRVLKLLWRTLPLAPRSLFLCEDAEILGAPFQILEYRPGLIIRGATLPEELRHPAAAKQLSTMMIETLAKIHDVSMESAGLGGLGRPEGFLKRTAQGWIARGLAVLGTTRGAGARTLIEWLEKADLSDSGRPTLLHNDFKLDNLIVDHSTLKPVAVLDWDMATQGDPLFDLATLLSYWSEPGDPDCMHELGQMPTAEGSFLSREQAAKAYLELTGRRADCFLVHRVLAIFKLGVVFHQLHARYAAEGSADPRHARFATLADKIFDFGVETAAGKRF